MPWVRGVSGNPKGRPPKRQRPEDSPAQPLSEGGDVLADYMAHLTPLSAEERAATARARQIAAMTAEIMLQQQAEQLVATMVARAQAGSKRAQQWVEEHLKIDNTNQKETTNA